MGDDCFGPTARVPLVQAMPPNGIILWCTCSTIAGGMRVDNPDCDLHHAPPVIYVTTAQGSAA